MQEAKGTRYPSLPVDRCDMCGGEGWLVYRVDVDDVSKPETCWDWRHKEETCGGRGYIVNGEAINEMAQAQGGIQPFPESHIESYMDDEYPVRKLPEFGY